MKAIIPTGGRGTRMRPLTFSTNKHFIPVANKPIIFYPIETIVKSGIKDIAITYNPGGLDETKQILGDGSRFGANFTYILQEQPLGLANIFQVCEEYLNDEAFLMHNGDNIFVDGIENLVKYFLKEKPNGLVIYVKHPDNKRLGVPFFDEKGKFKRYVEKPDKPPNNFGITGLYFFDSNVFDCFRGKDAISPSERGELEISSPYNWLLAHNFKVDAIEYKGKWMDPGKFDDWLDANEYLLKHTLSENIESKPDDKTKIEGVLAIGRGCAILNSKIIGPTIIGDNVTIDSSEIGPYASISENCQIINSKLQNSVLMSGVKVLDVRSHPLTDSLVGTDTEVIGANGKGPTTSLFVGEKCKIQV